MAEIDPVVLELRAEVGKYRVTSSPRPRSSASRSASRKSRCSGSKRKCAAHPARSWAGRRRPRRCLRWRLHRARTGRADRRVRGCKTVCAWPGLKARTLERVQSQLLELSSKYGVGIEGLAELFGKILADRQRTRRIAAAACPTDRGKLAGAQDHRHVGAAGPRRIARADAGARVWQSPLRGIQPDQRGGFCPLLQVIANTERFGGSVAKLRYMVTTKSLVAGVLQAILGRAGT